MQWKGLYKERNPSRKWDGQFTNEKRERNKDLTVKISVLTVNEQSILKPARGRIYTEFVLFLFMLIALVLLSSSL